MNHEDVAIELARIVRECEAAVAAKLASRNEGQAFKNLPEENPLPGLMRSEECTI